MEDRGVGLAKTISHRSTQMNTDSKHNLDRREEFPDDQAEDLRSACDSGGPALDEATLASLGRGLADVAAGRVKPLDEYQREPGL